MRFNYVKRGNQIIEIKRYHGERTISKFSHVLYSFGGSFIPPGQYSFPFVFKTGEEYPASFSVSPTLCRTNHQTTTPRAASNTRCKPLSGFQTASGPSAPNHKSSSARLPPSATKNRRWKLTLNLVVAATRALPASAVSSRRTATLREKMPRCTACWTTKKARPLSSGSA